MKKKFLFTFFVVFLIIFSFFYISKNKTTKNPDLLTTIAPYKYFIDRLTEHSLEVKNLVPEASDPHGYEPSAKELVALFSAKAWFLIGEPFEDHFLPILKRNNPKIRAVKLYDQLQTLELKCPHHHHVEDLHFWMSPQKMQSQVTLIAEELKQLFPEKSEQIARNLELINDDFKSLDSHFKSKLKELNTSHLLVSHPAFGYFCEDYHLKQMALENETQDPSPKELSELLNQIQKQNIHRIYVQKQHNYKMAQLVSESLNLEMVEINPYAENYFENLHDFADHLGG